MFEQLVCSNEWSRQKFYGKYIYTNKKFMIVVEVNTSFPYSFESMEQLVHNDILFVKSLIITDINMLDWYR